MTVAPACPHCHLIHVTDWAVAVDRWRPEGPAGYRARYPDAPLRATRAEAIADMCARYAVLPPGCTCPDERYIPDAAQRPGMRGRRLPIRPLPHRPTAALPHHPARPGLPDPRRKPVMTIDTTRGCLVVEDEWLRRQHPWPTAEDRPAA